MSDAYFPMVPTHEREHISHAANHLATLSPALAERWERATHSVEQARVYDAFLEYNEMLKHPALDAKARTDIQLQAVRCLRDGPIDRIKTELALIEPRDEYQTIVLDYRLGWLMLHRMNSGVAAVQYFDRVSDEARRMGDRAWEVAAIHQKATGLAQQGGHEEAIDLYNRVYNLSRRNGLVEYIPKALRGKGRVYMDMGQVHKGEQALHKAYELACRNELVGEQGKVLHTLAQVNHDKFRFYGLALEYYEQARVTFSKSAVWNSYLEKLTKDADRCRRELEDLDLAKIIGPVPLTKLRQEYLTSLVNGFVGIPGIDNRSQLGERIGLTRQAIHRNING